MTEMQQHILPQDKLGVPSTVIRSPALPRINSIPVCRSTEVGLWAMGMFKPTPADWQVAAQCWARRGSKIHGSHSSSGSVRAMDRHWWAQGMYPGTVFQLCYQSWGALSSPALFLNKTHLAHDRKKGNCMNNLHPQKAQRKERHAKGSRQLKLLNQGKKLDRDGKGW